MATNHRFSTRGIGQFYLSSSHQIADAFERQQGYIDALTQHGIPVDERLIIQGTPDGGGERAVVELLNQGRKSDGIVCYNDPMAGALSALSDNGIQVPTQISGYWL